MSCVTFMLTQHDSFIKCVKWVGLGLKDHDTIIKKVELKLSHLVEYPYLDTLRTDTLIRIDTLNVYCVSCKEQEMLILPT